MSRKNKRRPPADISRLKCICGATRVIGKTSLICPTCFRRMEVLSTKERARLVKAFPQHAMSFGRRKAATPEKE